MKAVATDSLVPELEREGEALRYLWVGSMKARIETGDLRYIRLRVESRFHGLQVERFMQGRERDELFEFPQHLAGDERRLSKARATLYDPVADGCISALAKKLAHPGQEQWYHA